MRAQSSHDRHATGNQRTGRYRYTYPACARSLSAPRLPASLPGVPPDVMQGTSSPSASIQPLRIAHKVWNACGAIGRRIGHQSAEAQSRCLGYCAGQGAPPRTGCPDARNDLPVLHSTSTVKGLPASAKKAASPSTTVALSATTLTVTFSLSRASPRELSRSRGGCR